MRDFRQRVRAHEHIARGAIEPRSLAIGARLRPQVFRQLLAHRQRVRFLVAPLEVGNDAFEAMLFLRGTAIAMQVTEFHFIVAAAKQHHLLRLFREILPCGLGIKSVVLGHRGDQREVIRVLAIPALDGAARKGEMRISDHPFGVEEILEADAIAGGAGARGAVEREHLGLERRHAVAAFRAGLAGGEQGLIGAGLLRLIGRETRGAARELERGFQGLRQALLGVGADAQPVHHDLDGVLLLGIDFRQRVQFVHAAIDAHAHEALAAHLFEHFDVLTFAIDDDRREQQDGEAVGHPEDLVHHLAHGLRRERDAVVRAARDTRAREQQA
jgi:hypothetical protein